MKQDEITRLIAILNRQSWVKQVRYPGEEPGTIGVDCCDGQSWRIASPLHLVRLKYRYDQAPQEDASSS